MKNDYNVDLIFLANAALYLDTPVEDPWFNATDQVTPEGEGYLQQVGIPPAAYKNGVFAPSNKITVLGCIDRTQFCIAGEERDHVCSELDEVETMKDAQFVALNLSPQQRATAQMWQNITSGTMIADVVSNLGTSALVANEYLREGNQAPSLALPPNQWQA